MYLYVYISFSYVLTPRSLSNSPFSPWAATPRGTSLLLTSCQGKCPDQMLAPSTVRSPWNSFCVSKGTGGIGAEVEFSWVGRNDKSSIRYPCWHISFSSNEAAWYCLESHYFLKAIQNWRSRKWPSPLSLFFTKYLKLHSSALLFDASHWCCPWDRNLPDLSNLLTKHNT